MRNKLKPYGPEQVEARARGKREGGENNKTMNKPVTYPRIGDPCLGVLKSWKEPHSQVMGHVQQFIIIILNCHVTKGLFGVSYYSMSRKEASQNPSSRK